MAAFLYSAARLLIESNTDEAMERLEKMLVEHPRHGRSANDLAVLLAERKDFDRAMKLAVRANRFVSAPEAVETIGWIHLLREEPEPAIKVLTRAVERRPTAAVARYRLGLAYLANGDEESARKTFREVIEGGTNPESDKALAELARLDAGSASK